VPMEDGSLRGERQGGSSGAGNKGAASRGGHNSFLRSRCGGPAAPSFLYHFGSHAH
jgi:hypothetical protein